MSDMNERSDAMRGSQPVGWGAVASDGSVVCMMRRRADVASYVVDGTPIVALYRQPQPTLTYEEQKGIEGIIRDFQVIAEFNEERCHPHYAQKARCRAAMLSGLLKRLG